MCEYTCVCACVPKCLRVRVCVHVCMRACVCSVYVYRWIRIHVMVHCLFLRSQYQLHVQLRVVSLFHLRRHVRPRGTVRVHALLSNRPVNWNRPWGTGPRLSAPTVLYELRNHVHCYDAGSYDGSWYVPRCHVYGKIFCESYLVAMFLHVYGTNILGIISQRINS